MSDYNITDTENEDISVLFVSGQKKKKAEEEERRKAEEEEAKRQAAEAQVRQMEEEMEERRRKAEEEKAALENAMREEAAKEESIRKKTGKNEPAGNDTNKSRTPLLIGIVAAVVVVVIILAVVLSGSDKGGTSTGSASGSSSGSSSGSAADYSGLDFNASYKSQKEGMDIEFLYPDSLYPQVTERLDDKEDLIINFAPADSDDVAMDVILAKVLSNSGSGELEKCNTVYWSPDELTAKLRSYAGEQLRAIEPQAVVSDEKISEYNENSPGKYYYTFAFTSERVKSGAAACWFESAGNDVYKFVLASFTCEKEGIDAVQKLRDEFYDKNSEGSLEMPGADPLKSATADGMIKIDSIHMGLHVPKDRFIKYPMATNFDLYTDMNGAYLYVVGDLLDELPPYNAELAEDTKMSIEDAADKATLSGLNVEDRIKLSGEWVGNQTYMAEYTNVIGGVKYWEKIYSLIWEDVSNGQGSVAWIVIGCPEKDKDVYNELIDNMHENMEDI